MGKRHESEHELLDLGELLRAGEQQNGRASGELIPAGRDSECCFNHAKRIRAEQKFISDTCDPPRAYPRSAGNQVNAKRD